MRKLLQLKSFVCAGIDWLGFVVWFFLERFFYNCVARRGFERYCQRRRSDYFKEDHNQIFFITSNHVGGIGILITHLPLSLLTHERQVPLALNHYWLAMFAYAITGIIGFTIVVEGFKHIEATAGSLIGLLEIVFGILFGILFFWRAINSFNCIRSCDHFNSRGITRIR